VSEPLPQATKKFAQPGVSWPFAPTVSNVIPERAVSGGPTTIENQLFTMHLKHRMRAFQRAFHMNPDYTFWYGWNEMVQDLDKIRAMAKEMRAEQKVD
jgi:hypothetical protein